jgi:quercetin dioxygenase-like cupin family protein
MAETFSGEPVPMGESSFVLRMRSDLTAGAFTLVESWGREPGDGPGLHQHSREDETFIALAGAFRVQLGDDELTLRAGSSVFAPRGVPHRFEDLEHGSRLMHLFTPGGIDDYFRRNWAALQDGTIDELAAEFGLVFLR